MSADVQTVRVELGSRSYPIRIGVGLLDSLGAEVRAVGLGPRVALVTSLTVGRLYGERARRSLEAAGLVPTVIEIPDGEDQKNLQTLSSIYDELLAARLDRGATLVALGGGVVGDMAGLAAATFLRGIALVQVPTTLVAQVDASIGGKTAVNHPTGKNLIGAFHQPRLVLTDVEVLRSLAPREFVAGLAEVIKYAVILDPELFDALEGGIPRAGAAESAALARIVAVCARLKAEVVGADETEGGRRAILNFGHTVGHAIEALTDYKRYLHGEAVAMGMAFATRLSERRGHCTSATGDRIRRLIERAGLPVDLPSGVGPKPLARAIETDKKKRGGTVRFVCVQAIGRTRFEELTAEEIAAYLTA